MPVLVAGGSRGTVASMRAGLRMIGSDMGGTPTWSGEAKGCRMRGEGPSVEGVGLREEEGGVGAEGRGGDGASGLMLLLVPS